MYVQSVPSQEDLEAGFALNFRPTYAVPDVLNKAGLKLSDVDVFEIHEAFAVSFIFVMIAQKLASMSALLENLTKLQPIF